MKLQDDYRWVRYWYPRDKSFSLGDGGYLVDPSSDFGTSFNPDIRTYQQIDSFPVLGLLGEPGIGKSNALERERKKDVPSGVVRLFVDLRSKSSDESVHKAIFGSTEFQQWINSDETIEIILDSLDECLVHVKTVSTLLVDELKRYPLSRARLRIACRTADWPVLLSDQLPKMWGAEKVGIFELTPLRRVDVIAAAELEDINADKFLSAIVSRSVVPFAIKPITLRFLLERFKETGNLPHTQADIYAEGCRILCEEKNLSRAASQTTGHLTPLQRLAVAERIAAMTMFCKRSVILPSNVPSNQTKDDLVVDNIVGGTEIIDSKEFEVNRAAVDETLSYGLFSGRADNRLGWAHWTYAEFLAARYLTSHNFAERQVRQLLIHPDTIDSAAPKIIPQLHETAAWAATRDKELLKIIVAGDPLVLLQSSVDLAENIDRAEIVASILDLADKEQLNDHDLSLHSQYPDLSHPGIDSQILPFIADKTKNRIARRMAIDIAEACNATNCVPALLRVALDTSDEYHIRDEAGHALERLADDAAKIQMRPLLHLNEQDDPDDQLFGDALHCLWPEHLTATELFDLIHPARHPNLMGSYSSFLSFKLLLHLKPEDLVPALEWVVKQEGGPVIAYELNRLITRIMQQAWDYLDDPNVMRSFVAAFESRLKFYDDSWLERDTEDVDRAKFEDDDKRRRLIDALVAAVANNNLPETEASHGLMRLIRRGRDFSWALKRLMHSTDVEEKRRWIEIVQWRAFDDTDVTQIEELWQLSTPGAPLYDIFGKNFEPITIESEESRKLRAQLLKHRRMTERPKRPVRKVEDIKEIIRNDLNRIESGELDAWWHLNLNLLLDDDYTSYKAGLEFESDLSSLANWTKLETVDIERIFRAARIYLEQADPHTEEWFGKDIFSRPAAAGYRALILLYKYEKNRLDSLSELIISKWVPIVLGYPRSTGISKEDNNRAIVAFCLEKTPAQTIAFLKRLCQRQSEKHGRLFILYDFAAFDSPTITHALVELAQDKDALKPSAFGEALEYALKRKDSTAVNFVQHLLSAPQADANWRERAREAGTALLTQWPERGWETFYTLMTSDPSLARDIIIRVATHFEQRHTTKLAYLISEKAVADLYIWMEREFPESEDPKNTSREMHAVTERETVAEYRNSLLTRLRERGTAAAVAELERIAKQTKRQWIHYVALDAQKITLQHTWNAPSPNQLIALTRSSANRLVESGTELLDVVLESLERLEQELQGETPLARVLWDGFVPKDEEWMSDYIKQHLDRDLVQRGIIVNREVQIRKGIGRKGEVTDIHVDAIAKENNSNVYRQIRVIIEVKGCWHADLKHAMKTQLRDRYLADNQCQYGLYLIGWFSCLQWSDEDSRKQKALKLTIDEARKFFEEQAKELSNNPPSLKAFVLNARLR